MWKEQCFAAYYEVYRMAVSISGGRSWWISGSALVFGSSEFCRNIMTFPTGHPALVLK